MRSRIGNRNPDLAMPPVERCSRYHGDSRAWPGNTLGMSIQLR